MNPSHGIHGSSDTVTILSDGAFLTHVAQALMRCSRSIDVAQFALNARPIHDPFRDVTHLAHLLAAAVARGVEVRLLTHDLRVDALQFDGNYAFVRFCAERDVPVRTYFSTRGGALHAKLTIIDKTITIVGSHNWTPTAFRENAEDSLLISSNKFAERATLLFDTYWNQSKTPTWHATRTGHA